MNRPHTLALRVVLLSVALLLVIILPAGVAAGQIMPRVAADAARIAHANAPHAPPLHTDATFTPTASPRSPPIS